MATISGRVIFDRNRSATIDAGDSGLANVPVILQNIATNVGLAVLTDANGNYSFINVPDGNYRIVEAFGTSGGVATPGDFSTAVVIPFAIGMDPPINFATNPPTGATNLDSITPNTLLVTIAGSDLVNQDFLDGPVIYTPIQNILDPCVSVLDENLIDAANNGTFGFFPQGTPANTGVPVEPYPEVTPDFTYVLPVPDEFVPDDGEYTVQNIMNNTRPNIIGSWWRIADHTTGDETGRMMVVNGFNPGSIFFILYSAMLGGEIPVSTEAPEWREVGTVINSGDNTNITVEFISEGPAAIGNDYAIDDVSLREIEVPQFVPVKTISTPTANVGEVVTYTVTLQNTCTSPLTNVFFEDIVPEGLEFVTGSVTINGSPSQGVDPNAGFTIPDIQGGNTATVTFDALVTSVPTPNPTPNTATITYSYTPVEGGIPAVNVVESNPALLEVAEEADVSVVKTASPNPVNPGERVTYTIVVSNAGPSAAENVILTDNIPASITDVEFSVNGGGTFNPWTGSLNLGTLAAGASRTILVRGTVSNTATGTITNTAIVSSTTPDPNPDNNTSTVTTEVSSAQSADVSVVKTVSPNSVTPGERVTYTIVVSNAGPIAAENVVLIDNIPSSIIGAEFSVNGGITFNPWTGSLNLGTLAAGSSRTILIRGTVSQTATRCIANAASVTSTTPDPNLLNNISAICVEISGCADLCVSKKCSINSNIVTYRIVVSNAGPADARNVILEDNIPDEISNVKFSIEEEMIWENWIGFLNIGTLRAGRSITIIIKGILRLSGRSKIINTARVRSNSCDPDLTNNTATAVIRFDDCNNCNKRCE